MLQMKTRELKEIAKRNQWLGATEALEWAYEVAMTYEDVKVARCMREAIECMKPTQTVLDFPDRAGKLQIQRL